VLTQQEGDFSADTRWCLEWFRRHGFDPGPYDTADLLSKAKNTTVHSLEGAGVVRAYAGKVLLLPPGAMSENYDPVRDHRISEWKICMHLIRLLRFHGTYPAGRLMAAARAYVDLDAVRELAYLLHSIAEAKEWPEPAQLFNGLGTLWAELDVISRSELAW